MLIGKGFERDMFGNDPLAAQHGPLGQVFLKDAYLIPISRTLTELRST